MTAPRLEIAIPVWGEWVHPWLDHAIWAVRSEARDAQARIVVYSDDEGRALFAGADFEVRPLPNNGVGDRCDQANADSINRALVGGYCVAPLVAALIPGRGTMTAAMKLMDAGSRAVMAGSLNAEPPGRLLTAREMSRYLMDAPFTTWDDRPFTNYPGYLGWRSVNGALLMRPIFMHPAIIRPIRAYDPSRAVDHFMVEGYLTEPDQVAYLQPEDGCFAAMSLPAPPVIVSGTPNYPEQADVDTVGTWLAANVKDWNIHHMRQRLWFGNPAPFDRADIEAKSDAIVDEAAKLYFERKKKE